MSIQEQIKIARSIASGTPREVAIMESSAIEKSGPVIDVDAETVKSPQQKSVERQKMLKGRQQEIKNRLTRLKKEKSDQKKIDKLRQLKRDSRVIRNNIADRVSKSKFSKINNTEITTSGDEGATATQQAVGNVAKTGVATTKNIVKGIGKGIVGARNLKRGMEDRAAAKDKYAKAKEKLDLKKEKIKNKAEMKRLQAEEFIQEVEDKKDSKTKKVIDIMRGKNSIKVNPDMKEDTVVVQDASGKDFVEVVDIVSPSKVRSDWRKEINVTEASAAWTRKAGKNKSGGLNEKGRKSYERENPGSDLKAPSKKVGNPRRKSFCARMRGMKKKLTSKKTARDPNSRINKSLRAWNC